MALFSAKSFLIVLAVLLWTATCFQFTFPVPGKFDYKFAEGDIAIVEWAPNNTIDQLALSCGPDLGIDSDTPAYTMVNENLTSGVPYRIPKTWTDSYHKYCMFCTGYFIKCCSGVFHLEQQRPDNSTLIHGIKGSAVQSILDSASSASASQTSSPPTSTPTTENPTSTTESVTSTQQENLESKAPESTSIISSTDTPGSETTQASTTNSSSIPSSTDTTSPTAILTDNPPSTTALETASQNITSSLSSTPVCTASATGEAPCGNTTSATESLFNFPSLTAPTASQITPSTASMNGDVGSTMAIALFFVACFMIIS